MKDKLGLSYLNSRALNQVVSELPALAGWEQRVLTLEGVETAQEIELWCRNPVSALRSMWCNPALLRYMKFSPEKQYTSEAMDKRLYNEMNTSDWWWTKQVCSERINWSSFLCLILSIQMQLPDGATVVPIILSTDKTQLCVLSGGKTAYPVYMTIGNFDKSIRRCEFDKLLVTIYHRLS